MTGCVRITRRSSLVSGSRLSRIESGIPILPTSWRRKPCSRLGVVEQLRLELARELGRVADDALRVRAGAEVLRLERLRERADRLLVGDLDAGGAGRARARAGGAGRARRGAAAPPGRSSAISRNGPSKRPPASCSTIASRSSGLNGFSQERLRARLAAAASVGRAAGKDHDRDRGAAPGRPSAGGRRRARRGRASTTSRTIDVGRQLRRSGRRPRARPAPRRPRCR